MKTLHSFFPILIWIMFLCSASAQEGRVEKLQVGFKARLASLNEGRDKSIEKLSTGYATALGQLKDQAQKSGKIDDVVPILAEIAALAAKQDPLPDLKQNVPLELKKLRVKYTDARAKILGEHAANLVASADKMEAALKTQEAALTKAGSIQEALAAKAARESLGIDPVIKNARDLLKFGRGAALRPAFWLRRQGDNIEVLVHYDSRGKVSMNSPVDNVREESGKGGEKGTTKAKVLGEFVGAKGFEPDPFVSYRHVFDTKDLGGLFLAELEHKPRHEEAGEKGLRLAIDPIAKNPHGNFGEILPPISTPGTYRIQCRYFIPTTNRVVTGFQFVQRAGGPVGGHYFQKKGKWESESATGVSTHEGGALMFYIQLAEGEPIAAADREYLVIGEVGVEQVKFSAYIFKKYGESGEVQETHADPLKQPSLVLNGELVER